MPVPQTVEEFQQWIKTRYRPDTKRNLIALCGLGLAGEAGEVADLIKKELFHEKVIPIDKKAVECGDVLFYLLRYMELEYITLQDAMRAEYEKVMSRYPQGFDPVRSHGQGETPAEEKLPPCEKCGATITVLNTDGRGDRVIHCCNCGHESPYKD